MSEKIDTGTGEITEEAEQGELQTAEAAGLTEHVFEAAELVARDLLEALVLEIKLLQRPWDALPQAEQDELIERLRKRTTENVRKALGVIVSDEQQVLPATVESVTFKDGIKATLKISKYAQARHALADKEGSNVIIVIVDPADYMQGVHDVKGDPDQAELGVEDAAAAALDKAAGVDAKKPTDDPAADTDKPTA